MFTLFAIAVVPSLAECRSGNEFSPIWARLNSHAGSGVGMTLTQLMILV